MQSYATPTQVWNLNILKKFSSQVYTEQAILQPTQNPAKPTWEFEAYVHLCTFLMKEELLVGRLTVEVKVQQGSETSTRQVIKMPQK